MPAEWEPHEGVWVSWPHKAESWPGRFEPVPEAFARMVAMLATAEPVHINIGAGEVGECLRTEAQGLLDGLAVPRERIRFHPIPTDDAWCRDHGPMWVLDAEGRRVLLDWGFNAWGGKYEPFDDDDAVPSRIALELSVEAIRPGMVLEGGSIDVNGRGTLLTTESCLLNPNRNPGMRRAEVEAMLALWLGATKTIWLERGIEGDDTDGHIDDLARFVDPNTVVAALPDDPEDPDYPVLKDNLDRLRAATDQDGRPLTVASLPTPGNVTVDGERVPASYANFVMANGLVLVPTYNVANDARALETLARCFPDRAVRGLDATDLIWGLGAFHCLTQQMPLPGG